MLSITAVTIRYHPFTVVMMSAAEPYMHREPWEVLPIGRVVDSVTDRYSMP